MHIINSWHKILTTTGALATAVALFLGVIFPSGAATIVWTNSVGGNWSVAANWDPDQVPGASDTAVITNDSVTVTLDISPTVGGIVLGASSGCGGGTTLVMNGQTLTLNGPLAVGTCGHFTVDRGTLSGAANATLSGVIGWGGGFEAFLAGTLTLASNSTLNITAETYHDLPGGTLINNGTVLWTGGPVRGGGGTLIQNNGLWIAQVTNTINSAFGVAAAFNNSGTFDVQAGAIDFSISGTNTGTFHAAAGATCNFNLGYNFDNGTAFTGTGTNRLASSYTYTMDGTITSQNLELDAGLWTGTNTLVGTLNWGGGYRAILAGKLTLASDSTLNITAETYHDLPGGTLINNGTVLWTGGQVRGGPGTLIQNNGLWIAQITNAINSAFGNGSAFNNSGTFDVEAGAVDLSMLGTNTGTFRATAGATCNFNYGYNFNDGTALTGTGTNRLGSGTYTLGGTIYVQNVEFTSGQLAGSHILSGSNGFPGSFTWIGGNMDTPGATTIASNATLYIASASLHDLPSHILTNFGTVLFAGGDLRGGNGSLLQNSGLWINQVDNPISDAFGGPMAFDNSGTFLKIADAGITSISCDFTNSGTVSCQSGTMLFSGNFTNAAGTIEVSGGSTIQFALPLDLPAGLLTGSGTIQAPAITNAATVSPGASNAVLTLSGNYTQLYNGSMEFDIGGTLPGTNQSQVQVIGAAHLDGLIGLRFSPGYSLAVGSSNVVFTANPLSGSFHCFDHFFLLGQNERMLAAYSSTNMTLTAISAPDPAGPTLSASLGEQFLVCWPSEFTNFGLYFRTNLSSPSWTAIPAVTNHYVEDPMSAPQKFFILVKP